MSPSRTSRAVACLVILASISAIVPPTQAENQCNMGGVLEHSCVEQRVEVPPSLIPPLLYEYADLVLGRYYVYVGVGDCLDSVTSDRCRGVEAGPGSTLGVFGLVYEESNEHDGLQRQKFVFAGRNISPDRMVLL